MSAVSVRPGAEGPARAWRRLAALARHRAIRIIAALIGVGLLAAAVAIVISRRQVLADAWEALRRPDPGEIALLLAAVLGNVVLTGLIFRSLMRRYGDVGRLEMIALIAASTLLNVVPVKPGLFGRIAWHRAVNGISPLHSARAIVEAAGISAAAIAALLAGLLLGDFIGLDGTGLAAAGLGAALCVPVAAAAIAPFRPLAGAAALRCADLATWGVRCWLAFGLLGIEVPPAVALALAAASNATTLLPLFGNALGLREWVVALLAPMLAGVDQAEALMAELINRAAELTIMLPLGLAAVGALAALRRRMGVAAAAGPGAAPTHETLTPPGDRRPDRAP
ncbi:MAG TPA: hypothetical protein PKC43_01465 [Phycisphaerales bacterium]|nr:hypothetical protein [Phycisphaerales bacterium]HMP36094.1 hypothetical protein [Phycisphaerales bacterium]